MLHPRDAGKGASPDLMFRIGEAVKQATYNNRISIPIKLDREIRSFIAGRNDFAAESVAHLVSILDQGPLELCSKFNTAAFILLVAVFCRTESSWASHRGLALLRDSLNDAKGPFSQAPASLVDGTADIVNPQQRRKARLGNDVLEQLIGNFLCCHLPGGTRLWCGLLGLELIKGCEPNVKRSRDILLKFQSDAEAFIKSESYGVLRIVLVLLFSQSGTSDLVDDHLHSFYSVVRGSYKISDKPQDVSMSWAERILSASGNPDQPMSYALISRIYLDNTEIQLGLNGNQETYLIFVGKYLSAISLQEAGDTTPVVIDLPIENIDGILWKPLSKTSKKHRQASDNLRHALTLSLRRKDNPIVFVNGKGFAPGTLSFKPSTVRAFNELDHLRLMICNSTLYSSSHLKSSRTVSPLSIPKQRLIVWGSSSKCVLRRTKEQQSSVRSVDHISNYQTDIVSQEPGRRNKLWPSTRTSNIANRTSERSTQKMGVVAPEQNAVDVLLSQGLAPNARLDAGANCQSSSGVSVICRSNTDLSPKTNNAVSHRRVSGVSKATRPGRHRVTTSTPGRVPRYFSLCSSEEGTSGELRGSTKSMPDVASTTVQTTRAEADPGHREDSPRSPVGSDLPQISPSRPFGKGSDNPRTTLTGRNSSESGHLMIKVETSKGTSLEVSAGSMSPRSNDPERLHRRRIRPGSISHGQVQKQKKPVKKLFGSVIATTRARSDQLENISLNEVKNELQKGSVPTNPIEVSSEIDLGDGENSSDSNALGDVGLEASTSLSLTVDTGETQVDITKMEEDNNSHQVAHSVPVEAALFKEHMARTKGQLIDRKIPAHKKGKWRDGFHSDHLQHVQEVAVIAATEIVDKYLAQHEALQHNTRCEISGHLSEKFTHMISKDTPPKHSSPCMTSGHLKEEGNPHHFHLGTIDPKLVEGDRKLNTHVSTSHQRDSSQRQNLPTCRDENLPEAFRRISRRREALRQAPIQVPVKRKRKWNDIDGENRLPIQLPMNQAVDDAIRGKRSNSGRCGFSSPISTSSPSSKDIMLTSELSENPQWNPFSRRLSEAVDALGKSVMDHFDSKHDTMVRVPRLYSATGAYLLTHIGKDKQHVRQQDKVSNVCGKIRSTLSALPRADRQLSSTGSASEEQLAKSWLILQTGRDLAFPQ